jgi:hypothetical protein
VAALSTRWNTRFDAAELDRVRRPAIRAYLASLAARFRRLKNLRPPFRPVVLPDRQGPCPDVGGIGFAASSFLSGPPSSPVPWRFAPPNLTDPVSQLCTEGQVTEPAYAEWCAAFGLLPDPHRKHWEYVWIAAVLRRAGLLRPGIRAVGFGVGQEPIPALLAQNGVEVLATDSPSEIVDSEAWVRTSQHAESLAPLHRPGLVSDAEFDRLVRFMPVDMNALPDAIRDFDFCWSTCAFEHLGSLENGLQFVERSLSALRPGGLSIHTTEFNLSSNDETVEQDVLCFYRRRDIEALFARLTKQGHVCWPMNLYPGDGAMDMHVDFPPYGLPHLKLHMAGYVTTSMGVVVQKKV